MTEKQYNKAIDVVRRLKEARKELSEFRMPESPTHPLTFSENDHTFIKIYARGNGKAHERRILISKEIADYFYHQELNRLMAKVHHLETEFSRL